MFAATSAARLFSATMTRSLSTPSAALRDRPDLEVEEPVGSAAAGGDGLDTEVGEPVGSAAAVGDGLDPEAGEPVGLAASVGSPAAGPGTRSALVQPGRLSTRPVRAARVVQTLPRACLVAVVVKDGLLYRSVGPTAAGGQVKGRLDVRNAALISPGIHGLRPKSPSNWASRVDWPDSGTGRRRAARRDALLGGQAGYPRSPHTSRVMHPNRAVKTLAQIDAG